MRTAAVLGLGSVCLLCMLFLAIVLPLRKRVLNPPAPPASFTPAPTAEPTPSPVPPPPSVLTFDESTDDPMPQITDRLKLGHSYKLRGTVQSNYPLLSVTVTITCAFSEDLFYPYTQTVTLDPNNGVYSYTLDDALTQEGVSLDSLMQFSELHTGSIRWSSPQAAPARSNPSTCIKRSSTYSRISGTRSRNPTSATTATQPPSAFLMIKKPSSTATSGWTRGIPLPTRTGKTSIS